MPWDKAYDGMVLDGCRGDCFIATVREALSVGFYYPPCHRRILRQIYESLKTPE